MRKFRVPGKQDSLPSPNLILWNSRGIGTNDLQKLEELMLVAQKYKPEVICITETHLNESFEDGEIEIPLYRVFRVDRSATKRDLQSKGPRNPGKGSAKTRGGGIMMYVRNDLKVGNMRKESGKDFELLGFDL